MQGGVISPLLANIYLNELDWELEKAGLNAVRYADDSIVMCKTPEELAKAKAVVGRVLSELGLELAPDKTHDVDFYKDDFEYLGFVFRHLHQRRDGELRYYVGPSEKSVKKFREDVKGKTRKTFSKSFEEWAKMLNPVIRGKFNYFLISVKACMAVRKEWYAMGGEFHGIPVKGLYLELDGYIRQRLRVNFANRGKRHAKVRDGGMLKLKYNNEFFVKSMELVSGDFLYQELFNSKLTADLYLSRTKRAPRGYNPQREHFFYYASRR
jgi:RNA-directed DNA polymerase